MAWDCGAGIILIFFLSSLLSRIEHISVSGHYSEINRQVQQQ
jgi:hypothetical protein